MDFIIRIDWCDVERDPINQAMGVLVFLPLGLMAGVLTTLAGQGGGLLLLLACSALAGPHAALAITAPALLLGNLHRATLLRRHIDRGVAARMIAGALPGALAGGMLVTAFPPGAVRIMLVVITVLAVAKALGLVRFFVPRAALVPAGFVIGGMTGTAGGAGVLSAPVLLSSGLTGRTFVGTSSVVAVATHVGRVAGYAGLGMFSRGLLAATVVVTVAILLGNALGDRVRTWLMPPNTQPSSEKRGERLMTTLEYATLVVCVVLSVAGLG
jgi:uncharacterized membrane protein YfcA